MINADAVLGRFALILEFARAIIAVAGMMEIMAMVEAVILITAQDLSAVMVYVLKMQNHAGRNIIVLRIANHALKMKKKFQKNHAMKTGYANLGVNVFWGLRQGLVMIFIIAALYLINLSNHSHVLLRNLIVLPALRSGFAITGHPVLTESKQENVLKLIHAKLK